MFKYWDKRLSDTRKAERYFKERRISFHFRDLNEKGIAKGELDEHKLVYQLDELIDRGGKQYKKRNLQYMVFNLEKED